jgi:D-lactate dehydrogenase (cytochrome)
MNNPQAISLVGPEHQDYLRDESRRSGQAVAITFPRTEADVRSALHDARQHSWSVTIQGARTGVTAGAVPEGGLILNLSRMSNIGPIRRGNLITVQPGALLSDIRAAIKPHGLFFPPDPTETSASIGGMLACNASGAQSYHYGPTRQWIQALRVILADGRSMRLERGMKARGQHFAIRTDSGDTVTGELPVLPSPPSIKSAAGYHIQSDMDLIDLFIGMEGTLGIVTEIDLILIPAPARIQALTTFFPNEAAALNFVRFLRGDANHSLPTPPVAIEFFDANALALLRLAKADNPAFSKLPSLPDRFHTAIYIEFHGDQASPIDDSIALAAETLSSLGANPDDCWFADTPKDLETLKTFRHATPEAVNLTIDQRRKLHPGLTKLGTDMSVPDDCLEKVMTIYHSDLASSGLDYVIFGHIGNNHVHVNILSRTMEDYARGKALYLEWARAIINMGGSISAEHGIGKLKVALLHLMVGDDGIRSMKQIKRIFDPAGLLNPGNLF